MQDILRQGALTTAKSFSPHISARAFHECVWLGPELGGFPQVMDETTLRYGVGSIILGAGIYATVWIGHDAGGVPTKGAGGEWTGAPGWIRPMVRLGRGPVLVWSVLLELTGVAFIVRGLVIVAGLSGSLLDFVTRAAIMVSILLVAALWAWLYFRPRRA